MIQSAKNFNLNNINNNLPNMSNTITSWFLNITFKVVKRVQNGADWVNEISEVINTKGVVQPARDEDLKVLPEGLRSWSTLKVHCLPNVNIQTGQYLEYDGIIYKVMAKKDFTKYGYIRYILSEAYGVNNQ